MCPTTSSAHALRNGQQSSFLTRDTSQAYVQSKTSTQRRIFVRRPKAPRFPPETLLRAEKLLYGIPEAGLHWY